ncbi:MAG TPA: Spy/CpxP family protein refolding chaperone [Polyangiaceae bacterium]|jgi:Spy/CpxP family protein refolding chaperone|nr:Spy/CpxP family protein refolding chaperone [Polyangiaceae bacterium]
MNRWIAKVVTLASLAGAVALVPAGIAYAQQSAPADGGSAHKHHGHRPMGLVGAALKLDSLTPAQRTQIEALVQTRKAAEVPVKQADAQVLTVLAQQVEQASINKQALAPTVSAKESAAVAARNVDLDTVQKLHDILTPAQRAELVDGIEARFQNAQGAPGNGGPDHAGHHHGHLGMIAKKLGITDQQKAQIMANLKAEHQGEAGAGQHPNPGAGKAWLDSFKGDSFTATAAAANMPQRMEHRADRMEDLLAAAVPVLTPAQRAQLATHLRTRAAHEAAAHT